MHPRIVVIGTSLGGLRALRAVLGELPDGFALPIVVVQHRTRSEGASVASALAPECRLPVGEPEDKDAIEPGRVSVAPADYHLLVDRGGFALSTEGPVSFARPSIDVLFESAADAFRNGVVAVVLTGANADGALGARRVRERGGIVIVQDPADAESPTMPEAARPWADHVLALGRIGRFLACLHVPVGRTS